MKETDFTHKDQLLVSTSTKCWYSNLKWKLQCCFQNVNGEWHAQLAQAPVMDALLVYQLANQPCPGPLSIRNWDPHAKLMVWRRLRWFVPWTSNQKHYVRRNIVNVCVYLHATKAPLVPSIGECQHKPFCFIIFTCEVISYHHLGKLNWQMPAGNPLYLYFLKKIKTNV